ncbi:MAG: phosphoribosylanthranilate isomerase [Planctomycetaceae bacterium]|nr:phosphoribosylanthranilate isomerase [Planctomycetaceae bacterium]
MWIKICGISDPDAIGTLAALRPDALGFNFYHGSKRRIAPSAAALAVRQLPAGIEPVGVFVNHSLEQIRDICGTTGIRTVQLHGDETPEFAAALTSFDVIRVSRIGSEGLSLVAADVERCRQLGVRLKACLVEPRVAGHYGGSGAVAPWNEIADGWNRTDWPPLLLAGGLTPDNVAAAVACVRPWGVDVASGVESSPGVKDPALVARFIQSARNPSGGTP